MFLPKLNCQELNLCGFSSFLVIAVSSCSCVCEPHHSRISCKEINLVPIITEHHHLSSRHHVKDAIEKPAETLGRRTCHVTLSSLLWRCSVGHYFRIYKPTLRKKLHPGVSSKIHGVLNHEIMSYGWKRLN